VILPEQTPSEEAAAQAAPENASTAPSTTTPMPMDSSTPASASTAPMESPDENAAPDETATAEASSTESSSGGALPRLRGRITVDGAPPELVPIAAGAAAAACNVPTVPNEAVVVGADGGLANCVIYLKEVPAGVQVPAPPAEPLIVDQKGCQFIPHVSFARVGQLVEYQNNDTFAHNVRSAPFRNAGFSTTAGPGQKIEFTYEVPEVRATQLKCDIHTFMTGWHMVLDHPWCAVTDEHGNFEISGLPEGELEFVAWHEKKGYIERSFTLQIDAASDVERNYEVSASELAD
jgi:plastocyanin